MCSQRQEMKPSAASMPAATLAGRSRSSLLSTKGPRGGRVDGAGHVRDQLCEIVYSELGGPRPRPGSNQRIDLTGGTFLGIHRLCQALIDSGVALLHGSNTPGPLRRLQARQANDAAKASGNQLAIYATILVDVAMAHAILNRQYVIAKLGSFVLGHRYTGEQVRFSATDNLYELFERDDPALCSDGYVYALNRKEFALASDTLTEFHSFEAQTPLMAFRVPATLRAQLFVCGRDAVHNTIAPYAPSQVERIDAYRMKMERAP